MIEIPVFVAWLIMMLVAAGQWGYMRIMYPEETSDSEETKCFFIGAFIDASVSCLALWLISFWWGWIG